MGRRRNPDHTTVTFRGPAESEREILLTCRKDPKARLRKERNGPPLGTAPDWSDSNMGLSPLSLPARNRTRALLKKSGRGGVTTEESGLKSRPPRFPTQKKEGKREDMKTKTTSPKERETRGQDRKFPPYRLVLQPFLLLLLLRKVSLLCFSVGSCTKKNPVFVASRHCAQIQRIDFWAPRIPEKAILLLPLQPLRTMRKNLF